MLRKLIVLLVLLVSGTAWGNGVYIPPKIILEMPKIPLQRALITYRNGTETLVLESALTTEAHDVGWIVPLPAEPTRVDVADKDLLKMLAMSQQPRIVDRLRDHLWVTLIILAFAIPWALWIILVPKPFRGIGWLIFGVVHFLVVSIVVPSLSTAGQSVGGRDVSVSSTHRIGEYEAQVLRARDAQALSDWLAGQSLQSLTPEAAGIVDDYIRKGWCFVVAHLRLDASTESFPRPLVLSFPASSCVFPMRLTQLAKSTTQVELYIAGDQQAQAEGFQCLAADLYALHSGGQWPNTAPSLLARETGIEITSPDAVEMLWPGCVVTKLVGQLTPAQMGNDVGITFRPVQAYRQVLYTESGRDDLSRLILCWGVVVCVVLAAVAFYGGRPPGRIRKGALLAGCVIAFGVYEIVPRVVPVVPQDQMTRVYALWGQRFHEELLNCAESLKSKGKLHAKTKPEEVLPLLVAANPTNPYIKKETDTLINPYTRQPCVLDRTPGNVALRTTQGKTYFCMYDVDGREVRVELPAGPPAYLR